MVFGSVVLNSDEGYGEGFFFVLLSWMLWIFVVSIKVEGCVEGSLCDFLKVVDMKGKGVEG